MDFVISVPSERVEDAKTALGLIGVDFNPETALIHCQTHGFNYQMNEAGDIKDALEKINAYLEENEAEPLIAGDPGRWSLEVRRQFLELASTEFNWEELKITYALWDTDAGQWPEILRGDYPMIPTVEQAKA